MMFSFVFIYKPFPKQQILDSSKLKEFADDNFKFDENSRKLHNRVENTVGKGEIVCYEQFLLFSLFFSTLLEKSGIPSSLKWSLANSFSLGEPNICHLGKC